ncbi:MAG: hypothetical protein NT150_06305, partial [Bacteroidetes bacterium]|nr:hypothetical protein [Bacteroidota bacterium]
MTDFTTFIFKAIFKMKTIAKHNLIAVLIFAAAMICGPASVNAQTSDFKTEAAAKEKKLKEEEKQKAEERKIKKKQYAAQLKKQKEAEKLKQAQLDEQARV